MCHFAWDDPDFRPWEVASTKSSVITGWYFSQFANSILTMKIS
jgi:hypothetical protein